MSWSCPGHNKTLSVSQMQIGAAGLTPGKRAKHSLYIRNVSIKVYFEEFRPALNFCHRFVCSFINYKENEPEIFFNCSISRSKLPQINEQ